MRKILVVDDEPFVLEILTAEFRPHFEVIAVQTYEAALDCLETTQGIVAVVTDWRLGPGPDGLDLLREVRERLPAAPRLMVSGHIGDFLTEVVVNTGAAHACVQKPWDIGALRSRVEQLLAMPRELIEAATAPVVDEALDALRASALKGSGL